MLNKKNIQLKNKHTGKLNQQKAFTKNSATVIYKAFNL